MAYTMTEVRNVLRNYEGLLTKKRADYTREVSSKQTKAFDDVQISKEGLRKLVELQQITMDSNVDKQLV